MSAVGYSNYKVLQIAKPERGIVVDTRGRVVGFDYYESVYSPATTASVTYVDSGESTKNQLEISGYEDFTFKIQSKYGTLDFNRKNANSGMRVKSAPTIAQESNREAVLLDLASKWEFKNKRTPVHDKYSNVTIGDAVIIISVSYTHLRAHET